MRKPITSIAAGHDLAAFGSEFQKEIGHGSPFPITDARGWGVHSPNFIGRPPFGNGEGLQAIRFLYLLRGGTERMVTPLHIHCLKE